jgi:NAD(P)-dependent dehydrogenase (short-subunit alcohol dehydrogenase family)
LAEQESRQVALISGASSGIGAAIAIALVEHGYRVFGTARNPDKSAPVPGVEMLPLEVRSLTSVQDCVRTVLDRAGHIDVLINNAGVAFLGATEECSDAEIAAQFDVNVFGIVRLTRAVLPSMRERRRGHIISMSSLAARTAVPFQGVYSATKAAIEGYSEALLHEVMPFGIHVSVIEPGFIHTGLGEHSERAANPIAAYDPWRQAAAESIQHMIDTAPPPSAVAKSVLDALQSRRPRFRYPSAGVGLVLWARQWVPEPLFYRVFRSRFNLSAGEVKSS